MSTSNLIRDPRLAQVPWRDLVALTPREKLAELAIWTPWFAGALACYSRAWIVPGLAMSFMFFLTGLRQSHNAQHYALGIPKIATDAILFLLSVIMLSSMHAFQVAHLHHHRHCLGDEDFEARSGRMTWIGAILFGPVFPFVVHVNALRIGSPVKRRWILVEIATIALVAIAGVTLDLPPAIRWHLGVMAIGQCFTAFFAVWTVHHGCTPQTQIARTQRGWLKNTISYAMFYHHEHHQFPAVPTCKLPTLATRIDAVAPEFRKMQVY